MEASAVGGQAGTSAHIRNYLGFPWGVRGADLAHSAGRQSEQLGAEIIVTRAAVMLAADGGQRVLTLSNGDVVRARCVILSGGVSYRMSGIETLDALVGRGVFYGAAAGEATAMAGLNVAVIGGGNSAGQAAAHLASGGANVISTVTVSFSPGVRVRLGWRRPCRASLPPEISGRDPSSEWQLP